MTPPAPIPPALHRGGEGTPLVLLHGMTSSWRAWRPIMAMLERHHEVYAITMPGHFGGPPMPEGEPVTIDAIVDELCVQLDELGLDSPHVAGNSLGGWVALELARRGRARSVVALSPAGAWAMPLDMYRLLSLFRVGAVVAGWGPMQRLAATVPWLRRVLMRSISEHADRYSGDEVEVLFDDMAGCSVLGPLLARATIDGPIRNFVAVPCPVRIAWAGSDRTIPFRSYGRPMLEAVPDADFVVLPGVGHVPMVDNPELVAWTILQHTRNVSVRSG
ncbi:MAG: alpha/beta fold hydrolase [Pseudonocardia sp.]|nr:alpha/beta fold hydrolase [Pseudonocardia sp.]